MLKCYDRSFGDVVSTVASQQETPGLNSWQSPLHDFLTQSPDMQVKLTGEFKYRVGVRAHGSPIVS